MDNATVGFKCDCPFGYSGTTCELQVDECSHGPCINGGTCVNSRNDFQCFCPSGFVGSRCEENVDDCQGNPCINGGSCVDLVNQFRCQCIPGYIGSLCENKVDLCLTKPCANGGTCTNLNNDYKCACRPGFTGKDCSIDVDECAPAPCKNGGTCVNRVNSFQCICAGGFRGIMCEEEAFSAAWNLAGSSSSSRHISDSSRIQSTSSKDDGLSNGQIVLIAILSIAVPVIAVIAACIVICMKKQRRREQEKDDAEARKQNEQNASHISHLHHNSMSSKRSSNSTLGMDSSHHMIKNTWDKSVNHVSNSVSMDECLMNSTGIYAGGGGVGSGGALSSYTDNSTTPTMGDCYQSSQAVLPQTIQRVKSQKQLNTDPMLSQHQQQRASQILSSSSSTPTKDLLLEKRISILSDSTLCNKRWGVVPNTGQRQITCSPPHI
jgi:delta